MRVHLHRRALPDGLRPSPGWTIRDVRYKLIHYDSGDRKLFDRSEDPWEQHDLLEASDDPGLERVIASLERLRDALVGTHPASASP